MSKIYQFSSIGALMSGYFKPGQDIYPTCSCSSIGLGCSELVNAEVTVLNGAVYTATAEQKIQLEKAPFCVPFYQISDFNDYAEHEVSDINQDNLADIVKQHIVLNNNFVAVRIKAKFDAVKLRRPYASDQVRDVKEISGNQQVSEYKDVSGCLLGFWTPEIFGRLSVPGFHLHFLSDDTSISGHVLSYAASVATLQLEEKYSIEITNPRNSEFAHLDINLESLDQMIEQVEK